MRAPKPLPSDKVWAQLTHFSRKCSISHHADHGPSDFVPDEVVWTKVVLGPSELKQNYPNTLSPRNHREILSGLNQFVLWNRQLQLQDGRPSRAEQKLWKVPKKKSGKSDRDDDNDDGGDVDHDDDGDDAIQLQR